MSVYAIAQLTITEPTAYGRYLDGFMDVFSGFNGTLLAADPAPSVIEGRWPYEKVVLMSFPDRSSFDAWATSDAYEGIAVDRKTGSQAVVIVVEGLSR